jgi:tripartite-type tricarboxylate transporter receptor subunit TctC
MDSDEEKTMKSNRRKLLLAGAMSPVVMGMPLRAPAQVPDYYKGKTLIINIAGSPAGGHTRFARMLAPYIEKHIGAKEVRLVNMPGGGGLKAANHVWRLKPGANEVYFGNVSTLLLASLAGSAGATFDPTKFAFLGRVTSEPRVLTVGGKSAIRSVPDMQKLKRPFVFPSQGTDEDFYTMAVLADALGFKLKAVTGYEGNADTSLAVIKGDGDGHITGWSESLGAIRSGDKFPVMMVTSQASPDYPNIPIVTNIAPAAKKSVVQAMATILETHRSYIGPPNMEQQAIAAFRAAVNAAMKDPALIAESTKGERLLSPMDGTVQQKAMAEMARTSAALSPILKAAVKEIQ